MASYSDSREKISRQLLKACAAGDVPAIQKLVSEGADVNYYEEHFFGMDKTPLLCAARRGRVAAIVCLIAHGADVNFQDRNLYSALMYAANYGHFAAAEALLEAGADTALKSSQGHTAQWFATSNSKYSVVKLIDSYKSGARVRKPAAPSVQFVPSISGQESQADEIVIERSFLGNRLLQEVFNFRSCERITVIRKDAEGPVESMTREPFSAITGQPSLREAFDEHRRRGGKTSEAEVFGHTSLPKQKFPPDMN